MRIKKEDRSDKNILVYKLNINLWNFTVYYLIKKKLKILIKFKDISQSVISLANPWADFIDDSNIVQKLN